MKKFLLSILIIFCFVSTSFAKTYNIKSSNDTIELKKSDVIIVELSENPSTGFEWILTSSDENIAKIIDKKLVYPPTPKGQPPLCGQGGTAIYKIKAIDKGDAVVSGKYVRPWENRPANREYVLNINVK